MHAVAPGTLGRIQRLVGTIDRGLRHAFTVAAGGHAHADGQPQRLAFPFNHQPLHRLAQALTHLARGRAAVAGQDGHEFLAPVAAEDVPFLQRRGQRPGHRAQAVIAGRMPVAVVDELEPVQIDKQYRQGQAVAIGFGKTAHQPLVHRAAVEAAGQRIQLRGLAQLDGSNRLVHLHLGGAAELAGQRHFIRGQTLPAFLTQQQRAPGGRPELEWNQRFCQHLRPGAERLLQCQPGPHLPPQHQQSIAQVGHRGVMGAGRLHQQQAVAVIAVGHHHQFRHWKQRQQVGRHDLESLPGHFALPHLAQF